MARSAKTQTITLTLQDAAVLKGAASLGLQCMRDGRAWLQPRKDQSTDPAWGQSWQRAIDTVRRQIESELDSAKDG